MNAARNGIALIGSTLVDDLVPVLTPGQLSFTDADQFVDQEELKGEKRKYSVGGMALNVGVDLAKINGGYPVAVFGRIGSDPLSAVIIETLEENGLDTSFMVQDKKNITAFTQVLHIKMPDGTIERIFRHTLGAMGAFSEQEINYEMLSKFKIAMFGYGLLLPQLDLPDEKFGTILGKVLDKVQKMGIMTVLDFVSPTDENLFKFQRYQKSMAYVDICCINEDQAQSLTGQSDPEKACIELVEKFGSKCAIVHCGAEGRNFAYTKTDGLISQPNFVVNETEYKGNAGAGDAFSAGLLHGIHQQWTLQNALQFAAAAAAISLGDVSCTGAMKDEKYILEYIKRVPTH